MKFSKKRKPISGRLTLDKAARHILSEKVKRTWQKQLEGSLGFLEALESMKVAGADEWSKGSHRYYRAKCQLYLEVIPDNCEQLAKVFRRRLEKISEV